MRLMSLLFGVCSGLATFGAILGALAASGRPLHAVIILAAAAIGVFVGYWVTRRLDRGAQQVAAQDAERRRISGQN